MRIRSDWVLWIVLATVGVYGTIRVVTAEHPGVEAASLVLYLVGGFSVGYLLRRLW